MSGIFFRDAHKTVAALRKECADLKFMALKASTVLLYCAGFVRQKRRKKIQSKSVLRIRDVLSRIPDPTIAPSRIRIPDPDPGSGG
jgi:hypothetical protein